MPATCNAPWGSRTGKAVTNPPHRAVGPDDPHFHRTARDLLGQSRLQHVSGPPGESPPASCYDSWGRPGNCGPKSSVGRADRPSGSCPGLRSQKLRQHSRQLTETFFAFLRVPSACACVSLATPMKPGAAVQPANEPADSTMGKSSPFLPVDQSLCQPPRAPGRIALTTSGGLRQHVSSSGR